MGVLINLACKKPSEEAGQFKYPATGGDGNLAGSSTVRGEVESKLPLFASSEGITGAYNAPLALAADEGNASFKPSRVHNVATTCQTVKPGPIENVDKRGIGKRNKLAPPQHKQASVKGLMVDEGAFGNIHARRAD